MHQKLTPMRVGQRGEGLTVAGPRAFQRLLAHPFILAPPARARFHHRDDHAFPVPS
jgi:hypothetical protein